MNDNLTQASQLDIRTVSGGPIDVNTYVVGIEHGDTCILVDPGAEIAEIAQAVGSRKVSAVLLTHAHFDHMLHAQHWLDQGAKLYVHRLDEPALSNPALNLCGMIGTSLTLNSSSIVAVDEADVIEEAGLSLHVLHTPGHTPGCVCYLCGGVLFSGDTLFYHSYGRVDLPGGNMAQMAASLRRLIGLNEDLIVYPGHDRKTKIAWERGVLL